MKLLKKLIAYVGVVGILLNATVVPAQAALFALYEGENETVRRHSIIPLTAQMLNSAHLQCRH